MKKGRKTKKKLKGLGFWKNGNMLGKVGKVGRDISQCNQNTHHIPRYTFLFSD